MSLDHRQKAYIINCCRLIMVNLPREIVRGPESMTALLIKRAEEIAQGNSDYFKYAIDTIGVMMRATKGKEVEIMLNGKVLSRTEAINYLERRKLELSNTFLKPDQQN